MNQGELRIGKIVYAGVWPEEILATIREVLEPWAWLIPSWANELFVYWQDSNEDNPTASISCGIQYDYRRVGLNLFPHFLNQERDNQTYLVVHDLLHGFSCVLGDFAEETIETLIPENDAPKFREVVIRELNLRHEQWTQDLAWCLIHQLKPDCFKVSASTK